MDISYDNKNKIFQNLPKSNDEKLNFDLFFAGSMGSSKKLREKILEDIKNYNFDSNYDLKIISYDNKNKNLHVLNKIDFLRMIKSSKCCLDLSGASNNLTMRFNEILLFDGVPITDRAFKRYYLSKFYSEYINDICFENMDELNSILFKYQDDEYRIKIKYALKSIFESYYNPHKHGQEILLSLE